MTDIALLKRQLAAAKSREADAITERKHIEELLIDAMCDELLAKFAAMGGVLGVTRVRAKIWGRSVPDTHRGPFVVIGAERRSHYSHCVQYILRKLKKDGKPSSAPSGCDTDTVFILPEDQPQEAN